MKYLFFLLPFILFSSQLDAQKVDKNEIFELRSLGSILGAEEMEGFYMFKWHKKSKTCLLQVFDDQFKLLFEIDSPGSEKARVASGAYCNGHYLFEMWDIRGSYSFLWGLKKNGEEFFHQSFRQARRNTIPESEYPFPGIGGRDQNITVIRDYGFLATNYSIDDKTTHWEFVACHPGYRNWRFTPADDLSAGAEYVGFTDGIVYSAVYEHKLAGLPDRFLYGHELKSGELVITKNIQQEGKKIIASLPFKSKPFNSETPTIRGIYFIKQDTRALPFLKNKKDDDSGYYFATVEKEGKLNEIFIDFDLVEDVYPKKEGNKKIKNATLHNILYHDSRLFFIFEEGSIGFANKIRDLFIVETDFDFKPKKSKLFHKKEKQTIYGIRLPSFSNIGSWNLNPSLKANGVDYVFSLESPDQSAFSFAYLSDESERFKGIKSTGEERGRIGPPKWAYGIIEYRDGVFQEDRKELNSKADNLWILPGKYGNFAIIEYFEESMEIKTRMEVW
jgi:hypothetical protein